MEHHTNPPMIVQSNEELKQELLDPRSAIWRPAREWLLRYGYCPKDERAVAMHAAGTAHQAERSRSGGRSGHSSNNNSNYTNDPGVGGLLAFACWQGQLDACKYLYLVGEITEKEYRYKDNNGTTPMKCACAGISPPPTILHHDLLYYSCMLYFFSQY
jgi:hypothetical protein